MKNILLGCLTLFLVSLMGLVQAGSVVEEKTITAKSGDRVVVAISQQARRYQWQQLSGVAVTLNNAKSNTLSFIAPNVSTQEQRTLIFTLKTTQSGAWKIPKVTAKVVVEIAELKP